MQITRGFSCIHPSVSYTHAKEQMTSSSIIGYSRNDWFFMKPDICAANGAAPSAECEANQSTAQRFERAIVQNDLTERQYEDMLALYNRELLFAVNMAVGLACLCYYVYLNASSLTVVTDAVRGVGSKLSAATGAAAAAAVGRPN
jgi:hypothetical protein